MHDRDLFGESVINGHKSVLAQTFEYPPFSVLNAREGWWQERKRQWLALGIESELGRGGQGKLTMSETVQRLKPSADQAAKRGGGGNGMMAFDNRHGLETWAARNRG